MAAARNTETTRPLSPAGRLLPGDINRTNSVGISVFGTCPVVNHATFVYQKPNRPVEIGGITARDSDDRFRYTSTSGSFASPNSSSCIPILSIMLRYNRHIWRLELSR